MRAEEILKATTRTKIYLDMDGVLADFFDEFAKLAGVPADSRGKYDYHMIPPDARERIIAKMVGTDFFNRLQKFPTADALVKLVLQYVPTYNICSSPLREDIQNSGYWKKQWIRSNLSPLPKETVLTLTKENWAVNLDGSPNILIDDRGLNIVAWRAHGGIGIKYQADEDPLDMVTEALNRAYSN